MFELVLHSDIGSLSPASYFSLSVRQHTQALITPSVDTNIESHFRRRLHDSKTQMYLKLDQSGGAGEGECSQLVNLQPPGNSRRSLTYLLYSVLTGSSTSHRDSAHTT